MPPLVPEVIVDPVNVGDEHLEKVFTILILNIMLAFISELSTLNLTCSSTTKLEGNKFNQQLDVKGRKELEAKMATVFGEKIKGAFYGTAGNIVR